jgi:hypothetical protein
MDMNTGHLTVTIREMASIIQKKHIGFKGYN